MSYRPRRLLFRCLVTIALLAGCSGSSETHDASISSDSALRADSSLADADSPSDASPVPLDGSEEPDGSSGARFLNRYPLRATFPEGGIYDPTSHSFFVGSLGEGTVNRIDAATGTEEVFFRESAPGEWWTLGMDVDVSRQRLIVCAMDDQRETSTDEPPYDGYVWIFDLTTGVRTANYALADAFPNATCTDVVAAADGTIYVCDREHPNLYRIDSSGALSLFVTDPLLGSSLKLGQNALVVLPDQSALLDIVYLPSKLLRISLPEGVVTEVDIDGDFFDGTPALSGADGMTYSGGGVLVAFTSQLVRVEPILADWSSATAVSVDVPAGQTDIVHTPMGDYLLNGQAVSFAFDREPEPFALVRFDGSF
jgi:sugar lactone lactonase YvrE